MSKVTMYIQNIYIYTDCYTYIHTQTHTYVYIHILAAGTYGKLLYTYIFTIFSYEIHKARQINLKIQETRQ